MITAIDTNILLDVLVPNEKFWDASVRALQNECDCFFRSNEIRVEAQRRSPFSWRAACGARTANKEASAPGYWLNSSSAHMRTCKLRAYYPGIVRSYFRG